MSRMYRPFRSYLTSRFVVQSATHRWSSSVTKRARDRLLLSTDLRREFNRTTRVFVPKLLAAGVDAETVRTVLVDNPARFLAFLPKEAA